MTASNLRVAFIGAGNMASAHLKAFQDIPVVQLSGICSRTISRAEKLVQEFDMQAVCSSITELYEQTKAQLVIIAVPELCVREVCIEAFKFPWVCLIEKPVGYNLEDAEMIASASMKSNAKSFVGLNRRHYSSTINVLNELSDKSQPRLIHIYDQENPKVALLGGKPLLVVQNWMYANSIHMIDYLNILGRGRITAVESVIPWNSQDPRFVMSKITYDSGDEGIYEAVWNAPGPWAVTVTTQEKRWEIRPLEQAFIQPFGSRKLDPIEVHDWDRKFKPGLRLQAQEAVKAASGQPHNLPSLKDALDSMRLIKKIYG